MGHEMNQRDRDMISRVRKKIQNSCTTQNHFFFDNLCLFLVEKLDTFTSVGLFLTSCWHATRNERSECTFFKPTLENLFLSPLSSPSSPSFEFEHSAVTRVLVSNDMRHRDSPASEVTLVFLACSPWFPAGKLKMETLVNLPLLYTAAPPLKMNECSTWVDLH